MFLYWIAFPLTSLLEPGVVSTSAQFCSSPRLEIDAAEAHQSNVSDAWTTIYNRLVTRAVDS